jgi:hypothetical protein
LNHINRIDDADDGGVNRHIFAAFGHACRTALDDQYEFAKARPYSVHGDEMAFLVLSLFIDQASDKQFAPLQAFIFSRRDDGSNYSGK